MLPAFSYSSHSKCARILDTAVCDDRNAVLFGNYVAVHNSGDLRNADTCYDTGRTDGTRSDTNLDRVNACLDESFCCLSGRYVTCYYLQIRM